MKFLIKEEYDELVLAELGIDTAKSSDWMKHLVNIETKPQIEEDSDDYLIYVRNLFDDYELHPHRSLCRCYDITTAQHGLEWRVFIHPGNEHWPIKPKLWYVPLCWSPPHGDNCSKRKQNNDLNSSSASGSSIGNEPARKRKLHSDPDGGPIYQGKRPKVSDNNQNEASQEPVDISTGSLASAAVIKPVENYQTLRVPRAVRRSTDSSSSDSSDENGYPKRRRKGLQRRRKRPHADLDFPRSSLPLHYLTHSSKEFEAGSSYNITKSSTRRIARFNSDETRYNIQVNSNAERVTNLNDYSSLVSNCLNSIIDEVKSNTTNNCFLFVAINSESLDSPIAIPRMHISEFSLDALLNSIAKVHQSKKNFIFDKEFQVMTTIARPPTGRGYRVNRQPLSAEEAARKLRSVIQIKTPEGLCLPAAICLGMARLNRDPLLLKKMEKTNRKSATDEARRFSETVLGHCIDPATGCSIDDLDTFQTFLRPDYLIKVFQFAPERRCIWQGQFEPTERRNIINLFKNENHYDLITGLPSFMGAHDGFCHTCNKGFNDRRRHRCLRKCGGCYRYNCKDFGSKSQVHCDNCNRIFYGPSCLHNHKIIHQNASRSLCDRVKTCVKCGRTRSEWGKRNITHICGEVFCKSCNTYVDPNHRCFVKVLKSATDDKNDTNLDHSRSSVSGSPNLNSLSAEELMVREAETSTTLPARFEPVCSDTAQYAYFDCEATVDPETHIHTPNLIVVQHSHNRVVFDSGSETVDRFCEWIFQPCHKSWCFISHYGKKYDQFFIMRWLLTKTNMKPDVIMNGNSILSLKIPRFDIRFIDSYSFLMFPLARLPEMFNFQDEVKKGFFPHLFNLPENYSYTGPLPDMKFYQPDQMNEKRRSQFMEWHNQLKTSNYIFDFKNELIAYNINDVDVLQKCGENFQLDFKEMTGIDPFKYITIASACNAVFRRNFLTADTVALIPPNGYRGNDIQSMLAIQWIEWQRNLTGNDIKYVSNGGEQVVVLKSGRRLKLDGFDKANNTAYEFYGCFYHGDSKCYSPETFNSLANRRMGALFEETRVRECSLIANGFNVISIWECDYKKQAETNEDLRRFIEKYKYIEPLNPRDAFFGGRTNAVQLFAEALPGHKITYADINSLYPFINKTASLPVGHPQIIRGSDICFQSLQKGKYFGLVKCMILPPRGLYHPVLPSKVKSKLMFINCRTCAETGEPRCDHSIDERSLVGTWCTQELNEAISQGYKLVEAYEVWHWAQTSSDILAGYVKCFYKNKQESFGVPDWCKSKQDVEKFCQDFEHEEGILLSPGNIAKNPGRYAVSKVQLNSLWGKFGQRCSLANTIFVNDEVTFWNMVKSDEFRIMSIHFPADHVAQILYQNQAAFQLPGINTNVVFAAMTTACARLKLYEALKKLDNRVIYFDTDSVFYYDPKPEDPHLYRPHEGPYLGQYKNELGSDDYIVRMVALSPKNYCYISHKGKVCMKIKGLTLNYQAKQQVTFEKMCNMIIDSGDDTVYEVKMGSTIRRDKKQWLLKSTENVKKYRFFYDKRMIKKKFQTYPWGYRGKAKKFFGRQLTSL